MNLRFPSAILAITWFILFVSTACQPDTAQTNPPINNHQNWQALQSSLDTTELAYNPTIISGKVRGFAPEKSISDLKVYIDDVLQGDQQFFYNSIDQEGKFSVNIQLAHPQDIMIKPQNPKTPKPQNPARHS